MLLFEAKFLNAHRFKSYFLMRATFSERCSFAICSHIYLFFSLQFCKQTLQHLQLIFYNALNIKKAKNI